MVRAKLHRRDDAVALAAKLPHGQGGGINELYEERVEMARFRYVIVSRARPGQEEEYIRWYRDQHIEDVQRLPFVVSATLDEVVFQKDYDLGAPQYSLLATYELDCDDPEAAIATIKATAGTAVMPTTDSAEKAGMLQVVGREIGRVG